MNANRLLLVHDRGQMCNNILQYGHVLAWARHNGARAVSLRFAYKYQYFNICRTPWHNFAVYLAAKLARRARLLPVVDFDVEPQADEAAMSALLGRHRRAWVDGWNVHFHDLFAQNLGELRQLFGFLPEVEQAAQLRMMPWLSREGYVRLGVHIRRGDYARFLGGRYYYDDATMVRLVREFAAVCPGSRLVVYVCGNDPKLDVGAYRRGVPEAEFVFPGGNPGEDLCVLSHCDYIIGAPSTFSLVASMYRDARIWWIPSADATLTLDAFTHFDPLYRQIGLYHDF